MKKLFAFFLAFAAAIVLVGTMPLNSVSAATVLPSTTSSPKSGCTFLGIEGKYIAQIQEALDRINEIRLEACKEGVKNPSTGNPLTVNDYVPIQWSADLEYIARIRAAEASVTMDHKRLNGESIWGIEGPNGIRSFGEVIAWNWSETMTQGIDQWYDEKYDWVNNTGGVTGHYTQMINPNNRYVGLGTFCSGSAKYYNTTAGEFSGNLNNPDTSRGKSTGNIIQTLEVSNDLISYNISGSDTLSVSATVTTMDYWSNTLKTEGLTLVGDSVNNIKWSSSNNDIVSVSNGKLTVKKCGSAVITAKLPDGKSLTKSVSYQHSYKTTTTPATCKSEGKIVKKCEVCGDTDTQIIPKTNQHSYETTTTAATCASDGKIVKKCKVCGDTNTQMIPKTNEHSYKTTSTVDATCKDDGKVVKTCTVCGKTDTQVIPKTDQHSFGKWETTKAPTEDSDGTEARKCSVCGKEETRTLQYEPPTVSIVESNTSSDTSDTSSGDSSSDTSSGDNSSDTSADDSSSDTSSDDRSSDTSSDDKSSDTSSGDNSSTFSSSDETPGEDVSDSSDITEESGASDNGSSFLKDWLPLVIIAGVLLVGLIVLVICLCVKRKKK